MSKLLEETLEKLNTAEKFNERTKNVDDTELDRILAIRNEAKLEVWQEVTKLVEKHEKPQLTEEQEKIYRALTLVYEDKDEMHPEDLSNIINTINIVINFYVGKDRNLIPALNKFLEEVEE